MHAFLRRAFFVRKHYQNNVSKKNIRYVIFVRMRQTIKIIGLIGTCEEFNGFMAEDLLKELKSDTTELTIEIDSVGGMAYEGWRIYYLLKKLSVKVTTIALKECKSAGTIIHLATDLANRYVSENTEYMIHAAWAEIKGTGEQLITAGEGMIQSTNEIIGLYTSETNLSVEQLTELVSNETTMNAQKCLEYGFASKVVPMPAIAMNASAIESKIIADKLQNSLGYKRKEMPQINKEDLSDILSYVKSKYGEGAITYEKRQLDSIKFSQKEVNFLKVYEKVATNNWQKREYLVSKDNYLIDGHHDASAGLLRIGTFDVNCIIINLPARELIQEANKLKNTYKAKLMATKKELLSAMNGILEGLGIKSKAKALDLYLDNGKMIKVASTGEVVQLGDAVSYEDNSVVPNGDYTLKEGTSISVIDGKIAEFSTAEEEKQDEDMTEVEALGLSAEMPTEDKKKVAQALKNAKATAEELAKKATALEAQNAVMNSENKELETKAMQIVKAIEELKKANTLVQSAPFGNNAKNQSFPTHITKTISKGDVDFAELATRFEKK